MRRRGFVSAAALFLFFWSPDAPGQGRAEPSAGTYLQSVSNLIAAQQVYPQAAQRAGEEGNVVLRLSIDRQGGLAGLALHKSSGFPLLDKAAAEMARKAFPVPPPPAALAGDPLVLDAPVIFKLEE